MKKFKLNALEKKEMAKLVGGVAGEPIDLIIAPCKCGCRYADSGGSSSSDNFAANEQKYPR